ncbi:PorP/SprF family type IX secretion system membrane protein [Aquimarina algiphila]|uniref:PorP/SprF family type IX secretion system membrane protein n=1 Tax=Aquimarina algiphila TaxID=2047982 RepID=UPI0024916A73|nr:PorP/SprF family type IX secretion system membrane protein [Aquimarina algiphila]
MTKFRYRILAILLLSLYNNTIEAQQTPVFSDYYYNQVLINPAHSGYHQNTEVSISNFGYLSEFEGNPRTFSGIFNTNVFKENVGISGGFISDQIGVTSVRTVFASYAYKISFDHNYDRARWWNYNPNVLSFGLTTGMLFLNEDLSRLNIQGDPNFENDVNVTVPTFGLGVLYNHDKLYIGFSAQNIGANSINSDQNVNIQTPYYLYGGYRLYFSRFEEIRVQPSVLAKFEPDAPAQFDFNVSVNYKNKIEIGAGYRSSSSLNALIGLYLFKNWRFAYTYTAFDRNTPFNDTNGFILTYKSGKGF